MSSFALQSCGCQVYFNRIYLYLSGHYVICINECSFVHTSVSLSVDYVIRRHLFLHDVTKVLAHKKFTGYSLVFTKWIKHAIQQINIHICITQKSFQDIDSSKKPWGFASNDIMKFNSRYYALHGRLVTQVVVKLCSNLTSAYLHTRLRTSLRGTWRDASDQGNACRHAQVDCH